MRFLTNSKLEFCHSSSGRVKKKLCIYLGVKSLYLFVSCFYLSFFLTRANGPSRPSLNVGESSFDIKKISEDNSFNHYVLVEFFSSQGNVELAKRTVQFHHHRQTCSMVITILKWVKSGDASTASGESNKIERVKLKSCTFMSVLLQFDSNRLKHLREQIHGYTVKTSFDSNVYVVTGLVDMYAKCKCVLEAEYLFKMMPEGKNHVTWTTMVTGYSQNGYGFKAIRCFGDMRVEGVESNQYTFPSVLTACASVSALVFGAQVHGCIIRSGFGANAYVRSALVDMYLELYDSWVLGCAFTVFNHMQDKDVISWTSLVTGCAHNGSFEEALKYFCDMRIAGICPDQIVVASILSACAEMTVLEFGRQVHATFLKSGLESSLSVDNSLVMMYAKCGSIEDANRVFDSMQVRDVITWTALIVGYAKNGRGKDSLQFYDQMLASGTKPDAITFIGLLFACSHAGLVENARHYFQSMNKVYGIKPGPEHYACMIDLLGRSGKLVEAKELLDEMVVEPDATVWKAFLAACRVHGNLELGERAAKNLFELEPKNAMPYVLLSNMYSAAGKWDAAARIRKLMKSRRISKEPGCSWIELNSQVHTFMSEDRGHPRTADIYSKIDEIMLLIKEAGYVPDMSFALHDMDVEGKELGLAYHSEKLAVAFALLTVPSGAPIRIFKNLRVCGDCHTAMKYISGVYGRHIILRDSNRFHHFREGKCSCGDYW
ncbi:hypothetical protein JRO89_XS01G0309200 [Xanthoceras sorbifolium]|uniref:DYW domain-containing protein n=1 Tax=Xanthoceras sorbifolium TaxID=99658 RepID=A0ABQ8IN89_9ROSI|nr:hypothetical protein JRO89_XS01G0309200 [Xanthoceras sorbifolium]